MSDASVEDRAMNYDRTALDNPYVIVSRDVAPAAKASQAFDERLILAMGDIEITSGGKARTLRRGEFALFAAGESYEAPTGGPYFEVAIKTDRPAIKTPEVLIPPTGNVVLFQGLKFFVYAEILEVGATRPRHSHCQRVEIRLSNGPMLHQWIWQGGAMREMEPSRVNWREPVVHEVRNIGDAPLHNFILEFLPDK
jgi:quercetin dioxygenase-like cupin family protein